MRQGSLLLPLSFIVGLDWVTGAAYTSDGKGIQWTLMKKLVKKVLEFVYLGSVISTTGGTDEDIKAKIRKAQQAFAGLHLVWR